MKNHHLTRASFFTVASLLLLLVGIAAMSLAINPYFFAALFVVSTSHLLLTGLLCCVASTLSLTYAQYRLNKSHIQKNNFDPCFIPLFALFYLCNAILPLIIGPPAIMLPFIMMLHSISDNEQDIMIGILGLGGICSQGITGLFAVSGASFTLVHCIIPLILASIALSALSTAHSKLCAHNKMHNLIDNKLMSAQYCQIQGNTLKEHGFKATYDAHNQVTINITRDCAPSIRKMIESQLKEETLRASIDDPGISKEEKQAILSEALTALFPNVENTDNMITSEIVTRLLSNMTHWAQDGNVLQLEISNIVGNVVGASLTKAGIHHDNNYSSITLKIEDLENNVERMLFFDNKGKKGVNAALPVEIVNEIGAYLPCADITDRLEDMQHCKKAAPCDGNRAVIS